MQQPPDPPAFDLGAREKHFPGHKAFFWEPVASKGAGEPDFDIVVTQFVLLEVTRDLAKSPDHESGGFLLGNRYYCPERKREFVVIDQCCPAHYTEATAVSVAFTPDSWSKLHEDLGLRFSGKERVGWYHSHPKMNIFLSDHDVAMHAEWFPQGYMTALVVTPDKQLGGFFGQRKGELGTKTPLPFYELLEGRELETRRTAMPWRDYLCFDPVSGKTLRPRPLPQPAPPPQPPPPPPFPWWKVLSLAAAVVVLAAVGLRFAFPFLSPPQLAIARWEVAFRDGKTLENGIAVRVLVENAPAAEVLEARIGPEDHLELSQDAGKGKGWYTFGTTPKRLRFANEQSLLDEKPEIEVALSGKTKPDKSVMGQIPIGGLQAQLLQWKMARIQARLEQTTAAGPTGKPHVEEIQALKRELAAMTDKYNKVTIKTNGTTSARITGTARTGTTRSGATGTGTGTTGAGPTGTGTIATGATGTATAETGVTGTGTTGPSTGTGATGTGTVATGATGATAGTGATGTGTIANGATGLATTGTKTPETGTGATGRTGTVKPGSAQPVEAQRFDVVKALRDEAATLRDCARKDKPENCVSRRENAIRAIKQVIGKERAAELERQVNKTRSNVNSITKKMEQFAREIEREQVKK